MSLPPSIVVHDTEFRQAHQRLSAIARVVYAALAGISGLLIGGMLGSVLMLAAFVVQVITHEQVLAWQVTFTALGTGVLFVQIYALYGRQNVLELALGQYVLLVLFALYAPLGINNYPLLVLGTPICLYFFWLYACNWRLFIRIQKRLLRVLVRAPAA